MSEVYGVGAKQALAPLTEGHAAPMGVRAKPQATTGVAPPGSQAQVTLKQNELQHTRHCCSIGAVEPAALIKQWPAASQCTPCWRMYGAKA